MLFQQIHCNKQLRHGFGCGAGLGDHVENGLFNIDHIQQRRHGFRIHIVQHIKPRTAPFLLGQLIITQMPQSLMDGNGAKCAAANAQHHKGFRFFSDPGSSLFDLLHHIFLIMRQFPPFHLWPFGRHGGESFLQRHSLQFGSGHSSAAKPVFHHVVVIQFQFHALFPWIVLIPVHNSISFI